MGILSSDYGRWLKPVILRTRLSSCELRLPARSVEEATEIWMLVSDLSIPL